MAISIMLSFEWTRSFCEYAIFSFSTKVENGVCRCVTNILDRMRSRRQVIISLYSSPFSSSSEYLLYALQTPVELCVWSQ
jgi:hypothetical protein